LFPYSLIFTFGIADGRELKTTVMRHAVCEFHDNFSVNICNNERKLFLQNTKRVDIISFYGVFTVIQM